VIEQFGEKELENRVGNGRILHTIEERKDLEEQVG